MIPLRPYRDGDAPALLALFRDTVRRVNSRDDDATQVAVWIAVDPLAWADRFLAGGRYVVVGEWDGAIAGFAELEPDGHVDRFYVSADHQGRGVGRALMEALIEEARRRGIARLFAEVSITARPFFERSGFAVEAEQTVTLRGVRFVNYRMARDRV
jgi:putative acetyltransferase